MRAYPFSISIKIRKVFIVWCESLIVGLMKIILINGGINNWALCFCLEAKYLLLVKGFALSFHSQSKS